MVGPIRGYPGLLGPAVLQKLLIRSPVKVFCYDVLDHFSIISLQKVVGDAMRHIRLQENKLTMANEVFCNIPLHSVAGELGNHLDKTTFDK